MMNPMFDQFTKAVDNYVKVFNNKDVGQAYLLGKLYGFMDFNLTEEQMSRLTASIESETIKRATRLAAVELV
jgi:hypothetical protein